MIKGNAKILHLFLIKTLQIMFEYFFLSMTKNTHLKSGTNIMLSGKTLCLLSFLSKIGIRIYSVPTLI